MKKVLITGANGLLGQKLVELYLENKSDFELIASGKGSNRNPTNKQNQYTYAEMDITDGTNVLSVFQQYKPDAVIHTAAMTNVDECEKNQKGCWKLNVEATQNIINACKKGGTYLLHLSTDFIFDGKNGPYSEEDEAIPISYYGESKLEAEKLVVSSELNWGIARTVLVYGITPAMSRSNIILWVKKSIEEKKQIYVVNDQWRTPTLAEDLAMGCFLMVKQKASGIYNISGDELMNPYEMALATADYFDLDKSFITETDGSRFSQPAKRPPKTGFNIEKAKNDLGYQPRSFNEGIEMLAGQMSLFTPTS